MRVYTFRGIGRVFGFTRHATGANLPSEYGPWATFKTLDLNRGGEETAGVNTNECLDDIEKHGFYLTRAHVRITESATLTKPRPLETSS